MLAQRSLGGDRLYADFLKYCAIATFVSGNGVTEYMSLFLRQMPYRRTDRANEGELVWVNKEDVVTLNIWEGDKIFFRLGMNARISSHSSLSMMVMISHIGFSGWQGNGA